MNTTERNWSFVLIAVFAAAIIIGLWYFTSGPGVDTNGNFTHPKKIGTNLPLVKSPAVQYFTIKELGVKFTLPSSLADLKYSYNQDKTAAYFSSKQLEAYGSECEAVNGPLGAVSKTSGTYPTDASPANSSGDLLKQFSGYYIAYSSAQSTCADSTAANTLQTSQQKAFLEALKTLQ